MLPQFSDNKIIEHPLHFSDQPCNYDMIIGRDLLKSLKIKMDFGDSTIEWDHAVVPMQSIDVKLHEMYATHDTPAMLDAAERMKKILDAKYEPADLDELVKQCTHLNQSEKRKLYALLHKYKDLFDGTLGHWNDQEYDIELKADAEPYHARPYPIPKAYETTLKLEVERLIQAGVLKKVNRSEWAAPTFIIPKKDKTVRFISDFRELNKRIKRKPYPIPKIQDLLQKLEGFQYGTSLDLNMGYYHIELSPHSKRLCTIVLPWGKYEYQRLPMGLSNSPDIFQERMSGLMADLDFVRAYIDDLLCISKGNWDDHIEKLDAVFARLQKAGLRINANKSFLAKVN